MGGFERPEPRSIDAEALALHMQAMKEAGATYLFESSWKKQYSEAAGLLQAISLHKLRHFLLLWLKKKGIDDALQARESLKAGHPPGGYP